MIPEIAVVPAGAGAGKTHHIKETLAGWVAQGKVHPRRILAVTFTEAAAGELRQRIRASLLAAGNIEGALELEQAYVTTIHALGQRLLCEHALAHGASPQLRLIEEGEQDLLLRRAIEEVPEIGRMAPDLAAHGYTFNPSTQDSAEDVFRKALLGLVNMLRTLGERGADPALAESAARSVTAQYGPVSGSDEDSAARLRRSIDALFAAFPRPLDTAGLSASAKTEFRQNFKDMQAVRRTLGEGRMDWRGWQKLRKLRQTKRGAPTPEGYDDLAAAVIEAAETLVYLPGPRDDGAGHARDLVLAAQKVMAGYARAKAELGVIDYGDMVASAAKMLRDRSDVTDAILAEIDCVIIDEFQDTSPIQFAFLWALASRAPRTLIVGDVKQAIMGFQGADPRLAQELALQYPHDPLPRNWRSAPQIMDFVNAVGPGLFAEGYSPLEPTREAVEPVALEVLSQNVTGRERVTKNNPDPAKPSHIVAERLFDILSTEEMTIRDRHSGELRKLEPRDVAVLCQTRRQCADYAEKLRTLGLPVRLAEEGWWQSPVVQAAAFALAYVADPGDRHAALCFASLGPSGLELEGCLQALARGEAIADPLLENLAALHCEAAFLPLDRLVAHVVSAAGLRAWCEQLPDPLQMRADLGRLEAEAAAFAGAEMAPREAAGFYGSGVQVFLGWLEARGSGEEDTRPPASGTEVDGIEIVTWHSAKGREWPLVAVTTLGQDKAPRARSFAVDIPDFEDLETVLDRADLSFVPDYAAPEAQERALASRMDQARQDCRRLLYVALTRARDRLLIEWPKAPSKGWDEKAINAALILEEECGFSLGSSGISVGSKAFSARLSVGVQEVAPIFYEPPAAEEDAGRALRHAIVAGTCPEALAILPPSSALETHRPLPAPLETRFLAEGIALSGDELELASEKGTALHEALRIALLRPDLQHKIAAHCRISQAEAALAAGQAAALRQELERRGYSTLHVEQPLDVPLADGTAQTVIVDLLAQGPDGLCIVDHKSGKVPDPEGRFATYWPQLAAYADVVDQLGIGKVREAAVFWTHTGSLTAGRLS